MPRRMLFHKSEQSVWFQDYDSVKSKHVRVTMIDSILNWQIDAIKLPQCYTRFDLVQRLSNRLHLQYYSIARHFFFSEIEQYKHAQERTDELRIKID